MMETQSVNRRVTSPMHRDRLSPARVRQNGVTE